MLRRIVSLHRTAFVVGCYGTVLTFLVAGLVLAIVGASPIERWMGVGIMVGGPIYIITLFGHYAVALENNDLLWRIAEREDSSKMMEVNRRNRNLQNRSEPTLRRKEPTI